MMKPKQLKYSVSFNRNDILHLDDIYLVQGLGGGDWWRGLRSDIDDEIVILRTITIDITVTFADEPTTLRASK